MKVLTITGAIAFVIAISIFLFQSHIEGIVEDSMMDATGDVVKESPIDEHLIEEIVAELIKEKAVVRGLKWLVENKPDAFQR